MRPAGTRQPELRYGARPILTTSAIATPAAVLPGAVVRPGNQVITVAHLIGRWGIGGLEGQLTQVIDRLPADCFRHVLVFRNGRNEVSPPVRGDVEIVSLDDPARNRKWALRLAGVLRSLEVSVVHNRELFTAHDTVAACRLAGVRRAAFSFHGFTDATGPPGLRARWLWRRALRRYQARWAVSEAARDAITRTLGLRRESFSVLRNGVDCARFHPIGDDPDRVAAMRRRLGLPVDRVVLLAVGNVTAVKNHQLILEAIRSAGIGSDRYVLAIVGGDRLDGRVRAWASVNLSGHDIRLVGPTTAIVDWYHAADAFVLSSRSEGMCNALLEAMACGLPVVATDVPGNREVVRSDTNGLLAAVDDPAAFGDALSRVVADGKLRRRLGRAGQEHVAAEFDIARTVAEYGRAYGGLGHGS